MSAGDFEELAESTRTYIISFLAAIFFCEQVSQNQIYVLYWCRIDLCAAIEFLSNDTCAARSLQVTVSATEVGFQAVLS
jgi:hypothetical protein